jgi:hypothetical protein
MIPFLLLAFPASVVMWGCEAGNQEESVTGPLFAVDCDKHPQAGPCQGGEPPEDEVAYGFEYPEHPPNDCWRPTYSEDVPPPYPEFQIGDTIPRTFWCEGTDTDPTFLLKVLADGQSVEGGTVTFKRCEDREGNIYDWVYCGVVGAGKKRHGHYGGVQWGDPVVIEDGLFQVTLTGWNGNIWGMFWVYDKGDGGEAEASQHWFGFGPVGYDGGPG